MDTFLRLKTEGLGQNLRLYWICHWRDAMPFPPAVDKEVEKMKVEVKADEQFLHL